MNHKQDLRPSIPSIVKGTYSNTAEEFQNTVLRPILKLQNGVILGLFYSYTLARNKGFHALAHLKKEAWVVQLLRKDMAFRNQMIGIVIGMLTEEELAAYIAAQSELNKRIIQMTQQRIISQLGQ